MITKCILSLSLLSGSAAFAPSTLPASPSTTTKTTTTNSHIHSHLHQSNDNNDENTNTSPSPDMNRRNALHKFTQTLFSVTAASTSILAQPQQANAESELFKANPLTNSVLEKVRIWNQDEVDNIKYGGELESGSAKPTAFEQYVELLQPILTVNRDLSNVDGLVAKTSSDGGVTTKEEYLALFEEMDSILSQSLFDKINFKKAFNAFADNIYYSDPDRANLYLGGGAIPKNEQSIAYLVRNDVLTNVEDMRAEVTYLLKELRKLKDGEVVKVGSEGLDLEEIVRLSRTAKGGMVKYLDLVPPRELEVAQAKFADAK